MKVLDADGRQVWPANDAKVKKTRIVSKAAAYIITDILAGNSIPSVNPFWGKWRVTDGVTGSRVRPAAYKTGTTSDNRDVHAYGYLAPPSNKTPPGARRRGLDGQLEQRAQRRQAVPRHVRAAVVRDHVRRVQGDADRRLQAGQAEGPGHEDGGCVHGHRSGSLDAQDRARAVPVGHGAQEGRDHDGHAGHRRGVRPALAGGLRRPDGHAGRSSTCRRPSPGSSAGRRRTWRGRPVPRAARASPAARSTRARRTSTAAGSSPSGRRGAARSPRQVRVRSLRRPRASPAIRRTRVRRRSPASRRRPRSPRAGAEAAASERHRLQATLARGRRPRLLLDCAYPELGPEAAPGEDDGSIPRFGAEAPAPQDATRGARAGSVARGLAAPRRWVPSSRPKSRSNHPG